MFSGKEIQSLNELELEVYNYIATHKEEVLQMKIRDIADAAHVSTTTVLRFCKKLGFDGYTEFKVHYKVEIMKETKVHDYNNAYAMQEYFKRIDNEDFDELLDTAASMIDEHKSVIFLGIGTSGTLGKYASRYFTNIGKFAQHIDDPFFPIPVGHYEDAIVVVLSVSGETEQIISQVHQFKSTNSTIISITNTSINTISKMSDLAIPYYMQMDVIDDALNLTTQIPVIFIIETLARKLRVLMQKENM